MDAAKGSNGAGKTGKENIITFNGKVIKVRRHRKVDLVELLDLLSRNLSYNRIAKIFGVKPQAVQQSVALLGLNEEEIKKLNHYRANKGVYLEMLQEKIVSSLAKPGAKARDHRDDAVALATLIDKQQLIEGKPTSIDYGLIAHVKANAARDPLFRPSSSETAPNEEDKA